MHRSSELTVDMMKKRVTDGRMDLSSLRLTKVPIELMCRSVAGRRIKSVDLSNNLLATFSDQFIQFFPDIQELDLHSNKIKRLPENFCGLTNLHRLDLSSNQIRKLPLSFAELTSLHWLNLADNPLENDLAEVVGNCSNEAECSLAAKNAVQYIQFFSTLSSESTAIADEAFLQNETSQSASSSHSSANTSNFSADFRQHDNERRLKNRQIYKKQMDAQYSQIHQRISGVCYSALHFAFVLALLILIGLPIWLTLDSIRDACVSSALPPNQKVPDRSQEERRLCAQLTQSLISGTLPAPFGQFLVDFLITFKKHWTRSVYAPLVEFIPQQIQHYHWWSDRLLFFFKFTVLLIWQCVKPVFDFLTSYFCDTFAIPISEVFGYL